MEAYKFLGLDYKPHYSQYDPVLNLDVNELMLDCLQSNHKLIMKNYANLTNLTNHYRKFFVKRLDKYLIPCSFIITFYSDLVNGMRLFFSFKRIYQNLKHFFILNKEGIITNYSSEFKPIFGGKDPIPDIQLSDVCKELWIFLFKSKSRKQDNILIKYKLKREVKLNDEELESNRGIVEEGIVEKVIHITKKDFIFKFEVGNKMWKLVANVCYRKESLFTQDFYMIELQVKSKEELRNFKKRASNIDQFCNLVSLSKSKKKLQSILQNLRYNHQREKRLKDDDTLLDQLGEDTDLLYNNNKYSGSYHEMTNILNKNF